MNRMVNRASHLLAGIIRKVWFLFPNDALYLRIIYRLEMGHQLDLKNPKTFTEKLQWLKVYDRKPEYTNMVDKIKVKEYVSNIIGEEYIIPTLGVWNCFDEIDFNTLPSQFILKTNHGSGGSDVVICEDKEEFDRASAKRLLDNSLKRNGYNKYREWPYKNVERRVFAEKLLVEDDGKSQKKHDLTDYKFFCFDGEPKYCQVIKDRRAKETIDFFDMEWNHQDFVGLNPSASFSDIQPSKPANFEKMQEIAKKLSHGIRFVRIDLYEVGGRVFFSEITFYPASGYGRFKPKEYDAVLGQMLHLS